MTEIRGDIRIPTNREAEEAVLGACITAAGALAEAQRIVTVEDFWLPAHQTIWEAILACAEGPQGASPMTVMTYLRERGEIDKVGGILVLSNLANTVWSMTVSYAARLVYQASKARRILQQHQRMGQILAQLQDDPEEMLGQMARANLDLEVLIDERDRDQAVDGLQSWPELWLKHPHVEHEWLVRDFMVPRDVFMFLAGEGVGKSWVTRQICLCLASGIHPFQPMTRIPKVRSLCVDLENAEGMLALESNRVGNKVMQLPYAEFDSEMAYVWTREDGMDLRNPRDAQLLERVVADVRPQLLAIGPLYKAYRRGSDSWDHAAADTREVLDRIRRRYNCALFIEHHMAKGSDGDRPSNPYGSSEWQRWASIGKILTKVGDYMYELIDFRGTRLERTLPVALERGGELPWVGVYDTEQMMYGMWPEVRESREMRGRRARPR